MKFSLQSLIALITAIAILLVTKRSPELLLYIVLMVMPFTMMLIAITCPQNGYRLDSSRRWYLHLLGKTWLHIVCLLALMFVGSIVLQYLPDRFVRALTGDFNEYVFVVSLRHDPNRSLYDPSDYVTLYDSFGYVGRIRNCTISPEYTRSRSDPLWESKDLSGYTLVLKVSTNRKDAFKLGMSKQSYEYKQGGQVFILDK